MKIIIFPFAGGNIYSFKNYFPKKYNVATLEYSGRGLRTEENLIFDIDTLIKDLLPKFKKEINTCDNYVIFGHSMGALVGYLICKEIEKLGLKLPIKLIVSGRKAPKYSRDKILSNLPDLDFWKEVSKLGGIPENIIKYPDLVEYFTPILKADFICIENYQYDKSTPKLSILIDVFYGSEEEITKEESEAWQEETTRIVNIFQLKGNHFFIFENKNIFRKYFKNLLLKEC